MSYSIRPSSALGTSATSANPSESLKHLFTRIACRQRPSLDNFEPILFHKTPLFPREIIELTGESNTGKTHLLMEFIARCVLPIRYGGCAADVLLIDTEHHFHIFKLAAMLEKHIRNAESAPSGQEPTTSSQQVEASAAKSIQVLGADEIRAIINASLKRCHLLKCHSPEQLQLAIFGLDKMFCDNRDALLLAIDSVAAFYWLETAPIRMDTYVKTLVGKLSKLTRHHGALLVYVKPTSFKSPTDDVGESSSLRPVRPFPINYCIRLEAVDDASLQLQRVEGHPAAAFRCVLHAGKTDSVIRTLHFAIDCFGVQWV